MTHYFRAFDLCVKSDLAIPGGIPLNDATTPDVTVVFGEVAHDETSLHSTPYSLRDGGLLFALPGLARYLCTADRITIQPSPETATNDIAAYLIATALPAVLWLRGDLLIHAAAAILPGSTGAVAIAGASKSGKSTLLHELVHQGAIVVAEDSCCIRFRDGRIEVSGLPGAVFLRQMPGCDADRRPHFVCSAQVAPRAELATMFFLEEGRELTSARLPLIDGLECILRHRHRPRIETLLDLERVHLPLWVHLAQILTLYKGSSAAFSLWDRQQRLADPSPSSCV